MLSCGHINRVSGLLLLLRFCFVSYFGWINYYNILPSATATIHPSTEPLGRVLISFAYIFQATPIHPSEGMETLCWIVSQSEGYGWLRPSTYSGGKGCGASSEIINITTLEWQFSSSILLHPPLLIVMLIWNHLLIRCRMNPIYHSPLISTRFCGSSWCPRNTCFIPLEIPAAMSLHANLLQLNIQMACHRLFVSLSCCCSPDF